MIAFTYSEKILLLTVLDALSEDVSRAGAYTHQMNAALRVTVIDRVRLKELKRKLRDEINSAITE